MNAQTSTASFKKSESDDSGESDSYQNMMIIADPDISDIYKSPIIPTVLTHNLIDSWSSNGDRSPSHKYFLISNNRTSLNTKSNINLNTMNIETDV
jgi:hypothetical protein